MQERLLQKLQKSINKRDMSPKKNTKPDFAKSFKELEGIVEWFEDAEVDLEEGLTKFERGLELANQCRARLKEVENKVTKIKAKFSDLAEDESSEDEEELDADDPQASLL